MAAAIAYIKNLGFDRETGNPFTRATHGSKSDIFTLEEKYTWLAVHYLKGYLSDYLPLRGGDYVQDYSEIVEIPNPVEFLMSEESQTLLSKSEWVIQDNLVSEMHDISDLDEAIRLSVEGEPTLNMEKWLRFNSQDFTIGTNGKKLLALYNYTSLHDSKKYVTSRIDIRACLVKKGQSPILRDLIMELGDESWFVQDIDRMHSNPKTDVYSNPSDLIWMNWIGETEDSESYHLEPSKEEKLYYAVTSVTNKTINGESEIKIPSKIVRGLLGIVEMNGQFFINNQDEHICLNHQVTGEDYVRQEMTLVREEDFLNVLDKNGFEIVWFIELLSKKNALNDEIIGGDHPQKCRKYFVSLDKNEFQSSKYWDARFSNK